MLIAITGSERRGGGKERGREGRQGDNTIIEIERYREKGGGGGRALS